MAFSKPFFQLGSDRGSMTTSALFNFNRMTTKLLYLLIPYPYNRDSVSVMSLSFHYPERERVISEPDYARILLGSLSQKPL